MSYNGRGLPTIEDFRVIARTEPMLYAANLRDSFEDNGPSRVLYIRGEDGKSVARIGETELPNGHLLTEYTARTKKAADLLGSLLGMDIEPRCVYTSLRKEI